jgi:hypothetical protein
MRMRVCFCSMPTTQALQHVMFSCLAAHSGMKPDPLVQPQRNKCIGPELSLLRHDS